jgi:phosphatidylethanolamine/phosphatidyl-N-methylethanolamine N-methyltransferase
MVESTLAERRANLADTSLFFRKFLAKGRGISSAFPSSRALVSGVLRHVDFSRPSTIVELGAGTGSVTQEIVEQLRPHHRFVAVEIDADFCNVLRRRFPDTTLLQTDATAVAEPLAKLGIHRVDYVISGLPTPNLPPRAMVRLWRWLHRCLAPNGAFIQITVAPMVYRAFYARLFDCVRYQMVWLNLPPGGVYQCARPRRHLYRR